MQITGVALFDRKCMFETVPVIFLLNFVCSITCENFFFNKSYALQLGQRSTSSNNGTERYSMSAWSMFHSVFVIFAEFYSV